MINKLKEVGVWGKVDEQVFDKILAQVRDQVRGQVNDRVEGPIWRQTWEEVGFKALGKVRSDMVYET